MISMNCFGMLDIHSAPEICGFGYVVSGTSGVVGTEVIGFGLEWLRVCLGSGLRVSR